MSMILSRALIIRLFLTLCLLAVLLPAGSARAGDDQPPTQPVIQSAAQSSMPYFHFPPVDGATISGYFDHNQNRGIVTFYDGRQNLPGKGFYFNCSNPAMYDWVGCADPVSGEGACSNNRELWYDEHHGIDFEYSPDWNTGAYCDPGRFAGITRAVYAPARGQVLMAGYDPNRPANGWHIRLKHDLNGNGNFNDDNFRSVYLHFTAYALAVVPGQIVNEGDYLGLGGSTGYSSSPHLHFEVQRSSDYFQTTYWPVDPFGWQSQSADPYPFAYSGVNLWKQAVSYKYSTYLPVVINAPLTCWDCGEKLQNGDFEAGQTAWVEPDRQVIFKAAEAGLPVPPYSGEWLARLGGANSVTDNLYQEFTVPANIRSATLRYQLRVETEEGGETPRDYLYVRLRLPDGTVLQDADFINNTFIPAGQWVQREVALVDLSAYQGQTVRVSFKATTNDSLPTSFYLEDVSLMAVGP